MQSFLIFGGGELQISLIKKVKELGYMAIVIDPNPNAIGKKYADAFYEIDGKDYSGTEKCAIDNNISGIVTSATDLPILMMARIAQSLNFSFPSFDACQTILDKNLFKRFLAINNINHAKGKQYSETEEINIDSLKFPLIFKPVSGSGSRGVVKCERKGDIEICRKRCLKHSRDKKFLVEEFISGEEISVEAIVYKGVVHIIQLTDKIVTPPPYNVELGHKQPSKFGYLEEEIHQILQKIIDELKISSCSIHPEIIIDKNDNIYLIEMGPRLGGDYITSHLVPLSTGIDIEKAYLNLSMDIEPQILKSRKNNASAIFYFNFKPGSKINSDQIKNILSKNIHVTDYQLSLGDNKKTPVISNSLDRYGFYIMKAESLNELSEAQTEIDKKINEYVEWK